jgi:site-specific DNA recombinase
MHTTQGAIYARVSAEQQAETPTMARQVAALRERVATAGRAVSEARQCLDAG